MQIPVMLPEKLSASRCLIEVEEDATTDLAGDAGAVGRFGIVRHGQAQLDLKGITPFQHVYAVCLLLEVSYVPNSSLSWSL